MIEVWTAIELLLNLRHFLCRLFLHKVIELETETLELGLQALVLGAKLHHDLLLLGQGLALRVWVLDVPEVAR